MGKSTAPEVVIFKSFQRSWVNINTEDYQLPDRYPKILGSRRRAELIAFALAKIDVSNVKLLHLTLQKYLFIITGSTTSGRLP